MSSASFVMRAVSRSICPLVAIPQVVRSGRSTTARECVSLSTVASSSMPPNWGPSWTGGTYAPSIIGADYIVLTIDPSLLVSLSHYGSGNRRHA
jgi:hypothetical protein